MIARNDQPFMAGFSFGTESIFNAIQTGTSSSSPISPHQFLLLDGTSFLLLDGENFYLLGT